MSNWLSAHIGILTVTGQQLQDRQREENYWSAQPCKLQKSCLASLVFQLSSWELAAHCILTHLPIQSRLKRLNTTLGTVFASFSS